jgi:hypothetical protein
MTDLGQGRDVSGIWATISKPGPVWRALAVLPWLGADTRVFGKRIEVLERSTHGACVLHALQGADREALSTLAALARINERRAQAGFRVTAVVNLTAPIAYTVAAAEMFSDQFNAIIRELEADGLLAIMIAGLVALVFLVLSFAHLRAREASDLVDLVTLVQARRGDGGVTGEVDAL